MHAPWMIYGANGYTGRLIARLAVSRGMKPVLAGRNPTAVRDIANELDLEARVFGLDEPSLLRKELEPMAAVLHAAGPFSATALPMAEGCLETGTHYLDITGEIEVFESLHGLDARAREEGVVILPGVGFDVVPTDCAAKRVAQMLDGATWLDVAFYHRGSSSRGTLRTMIEGMAQPGKVRRNSTIVPIPAGTVTRTIPFSDRDRFGVCIPWGDVSTAFRSTGIPNITVYLAMPPRRAKSVRLAGALRPLMKVGAVQRLLKWWIGKTVRGPGTAELEESYARIWCRASDDADRYRHVDLKTPNGYKLTADAAVTAVQRLLGDDYSGPTSGSLTPSLAFGADFVSQLEGVEWQ